MKQKIQLSDHFTIGKILLFSLPTIGMQIVDNTYQVADGYFISNFIGPSEFAAENLIFPPMMIVFAIGLMFGSGASALISYERGKGNEERANRLMSMLLLALTAISIVASVAMFILMPTISRLVGATEDMIPACVEYGRILAGFAPFMMLNMAFHPLLVAAEKPTLGFVVSIVNAAVNIALDALFVMIFRWGMAGAAVATGFAWLVSACIPAWHFFRAREGLRFARPCRDVKALFKSMYNGSSEMLDAIAYSVVSLVFNLRLMTLAGEAGVDAAAVTDYVVGFFTAVFFGISMSMTPVVGYHLGENNRIELRSLWKKGFWMMLISGTAIGVMCFALAEPIARIFVGYDESLTAMGTEALLCSSFAFVLSGVNIYSAGYYTGMNDGTSSLILSAVKSFIMPLALVFLLPLIFGLRGIWLTTVGAELVAAGIMVVLNLRKQNRDIFFGSK